MRILFVCLRERRTEREVFAEVCLLVGKSATENFENADLYKHSGPLQRCIGEYMLIVKYVVDMM